MRLRGLLDGISITCGTGGFIPAACKHDPGMAERCDGLFPRYGRAILKKIIEPTAGFRMLNQNMDRNPRTRKIPARLRESPDSRPWALWR